jgi:hypothetical protein
MPDFETDCKVLDLYWICCSAVIIACVEEEKSVFLRKVSNHLQVHPMVEPRRPTWTTLPTENLKSLTVCLGTYAPLHELLGVNLDIR